MPPQEESELNISHYLIMKADAEEALRLARDWWEDKKIPSYIEVRQLKETEVEEFVTLYNRCFLASPDPFCPLTTTEAEKLETEGIFVAELWGELSGFIACFVEEDNRGVYGEITGIGVLPERRRRGVGTAMIQRASEYFIDAGIEEIYCEIFEENHPSKMLVMAYGFEEVRRRPVKLKKSGQPAEEEEVPGGKIMRRLGLSPRPGCDSCRDI
ncbi:MAG: GNAT family N-acetyltransferase [Promethearchaeia archaeon]